MSEQRRQRVLRGAEEQVAEANALFRRYQRHLARERKVLLDGEHAQGVHALITLLRSLTPDQAPELIALLEKFHWFRDATDDDRAKILNIIDTAIIRMNERDGRPPFDDSLPGEVPTAWDICREKLGSRS